MRKFKTALIGFGKVSQGYSEDKLMLKFCKFPTHASVLKKHNYFDWQIVIDNDLNACKLAANKWKVPFVFDSLEKGKNYLKDVEIAVIATPPKYREEILDFCPALKAIIVEKPLGLDYKSSKIFIDRCINRKIKVQVNFWRRGDSFFNELANGGMDKMLGKIQIVYGIYGNGLRNNGSHMIDMIRMLFGEIDDYHKLNHINEFVEGPINGDKNIGFILNTRKGIPVVFSPVKFCFYRENGIIIYGERGRLDLLNEGISNKFCPSQPSRSTTGSNEVSYENFKNLKNVSELGFLSMYDNLLEAIDNKSSLFCDGESALKNEKIIENLLKN